METSGISLNKNSNITRARVFEWLGVVTAIIYSLLVAANIGAEFIGFTLLLTSSALIGIWAYLGKAQRNSLLAVLLCSSWNYWNDSLVLNDCCLLLDNHS